MSMAQTVSGFVVNENNEPVIGAKLMELNSMNGTTSNIDGSFILDLEVADTPVIFSFIGYQTDTVTLNTQILSQVVLKTKIESSLLDIFLDYRVLLIILWAIICTWLVLRTFRGKADA
jgi:hypothetical protein